MNRWPEILLGITLLPPIGLVAILLQQRWCAGDHDLVIGLSVWAAALIVAIVGLVRSNS